MKVALILFVSASLAFAQNCPDLDHPHCDADYMHCPGGFDEIGCMMPDFCVPMKGGNYQKYN